MIGATRVFIIKKGRKGRVGVTYHKIVVVYERLVGSRVLKGTFLAPVDHLADERSPSSSLARHDSFRPESLRLALLHA
jgi:hypothetical protein